MSEHAPKPPLGLRPRHIVDELRQTEILNAYDRYTDAGIPIPTAWKNEYAELITRLGHPVGQGGLSGLIIQ